jgi:phosphonate transport system substrate-binding protein
MMSFRARGLTCLVAIVAAATGSSLAARTKTNEICPSGTLTFGAPGYVKVDDPTKAYAYFVQLMAEKTGCKIETRISTSLNAQIDDLRANRFDFGPMRSSNYVLAHDQGLADAVAARSNAEGTGPYVETASIVVKASSPYHSIADLRGQKFAYSDTASDTGAIFPRFALGHAGLDPDTDVVPVYAMRHKYSFLFLKDGIVEAAEVNTRVERDNAKDPSYHAGDYRVLWKSEPIPYNPIVVRTGLAPAAKAKLTAALLSLDMSKIPDPEAWFWKPKLVPVSDATFAMFRDAMREGKFNMVSMPGNFP